VSARHKFADFPRGLFRCLQKLDQRLFMSHEISEDQLIHYFAGECSEKEAAKIEAWISADPDRERRVARLRQIWEAAEREPQSSPDADAMWDRLERRLGSSEQERKESEPSRQSVNRSRRKGELRSQRVGGYLGFPLRVLTVSVLVLVLGIWTVYEWEPVRQRASSMRTITTKAGQRAQIQLGDGTQVKLNAQTTLILPPKFGSEKRKVILRGQAYFEVTPDEDRPFLVHTKNIVTKVLGTKFDVGSYPDDEEVRIVVAEGKVAVRSSGEKTGGDMTLSDRQMASLSDSGKSVVRRGIDTGPYLAWTEGELLFRDASFSEVRQRLRSWYGLRVKLEGSPEAVGHLNATFTDEPIEEVLSIVAETLDLRYEREGEEVTFFFQR